MGKGTCSQQPEFDPQDPYGRERCDSYKLSTDCYMHAMAYTHTHNTKKNWISELIEKWMTIETIKK